MQLFEAIKLREICGCDALWDAGHIVTDAVTRVREQVGRDRVLLGLSGGVDSSVVAALLHRVIRVDAADRVFTALGDEEDPERKRKIIGRLF